MEIKQLKALVTVAEAGSVTRAAELLDLVQPAVTRQIRALELELGVPLFERSRQGMLLTEAGIRLLDRARRVLGELERAQAETRPAADAITGIVSVGLLDSTADLLAEPLVRAIADRHPAIELRIVTGFSGHLREWLDKGDLDISLLYNLASTPQLNIVPLVQERLWVVAPAESGLDEDSPVPFREAAGRPLIVPTPGHGLRFLIDQAAARAGVTLDIALTTNSMSLQKKLMLAGHGWTILPAIGIAEGLSRGVLAGAPLCEPDVIRAVVLGRSRTARTSAPVAVVATELQAQVRSAVVEGEWPTAVVDLAGSTPRSEPLL